jgi:hypothetical protein
MRIFTKSLLAFVMLCIAGVMNAETVETIIKRADFSRGATVGWFGKPDGATASVADGNFVIYNPSATDVNYAVQGFILSGASLQAGTSYKVAITYKYEPAEGQPNTANVFVALGDWSPNWVGKEEVQLTASDEFQTLTLSFDDYPADRSGGVMWQSGFTVGTIRIAKVDLIMLEDLEPAPEGMMYDSYLVVHSGEALSNAGEHWKQRVKCNLPEALVPEAQYTFKVSLKAANPGENHKIEFYATGATEQWAGKNDCPTSEFAEYSWTFTANSANNQIGFSCALLDGDFMIDNASLKKAGEDKELIPDGTFDGEGRLFWDDWTTTWEGLAAPTFEIGRQVVLDPNYSPGGGVTLADTDPVLVAHKYALQTAITKGKKANLEGKTIASRKALAAAIAVGQSIVNKAGGTLEDIDQARLDILNAIDELQDRTVPVGEKEVPKGWKSVITNGNLESRDMSCFFSKVGGGDTENSLTYDYEGTDDFHAIVIETLGSKKTQNWDDQFFIRANEEIPGGSKIHVEFDYRSDVADNVDSQVHNEPGAYIPADGIGNQSYKPEWQHFTYEGAASATFRTIAFNLSANNKDTKIVIDNIVFWVELPKAKKDLTVNGSFDGTAVPNVMVKVAPSSAVVPATATEGAGTEGSKGLKIEAPAKVTNDYETQMWIVSPYVLPAGTSVQVEFDYKADVAAKVATQAHENPGNYIHYACAGDVEFTTEWKHFKATFAVPSQCDGKPNNENTYNKDFRSIAFNMSMSAATTYYIDNVKLLVDEETVDQIIATGVQAVRPAAVSDGQYYDLQGRRVAQPVKGMYIVNGKKTIVK